MLAFLDQAATWLELNNRLMPNGRFMVNCGAGEDGLSEINDAVSPNEDSSTDGTWELNATIKALCKAFPGQVWCFLFSTYCASPLNSIIDDF